MTDIDKINEELRNYKLYQIQRLNTREAEFSELKSDLTTIKKNEIFNLIVVFINAASISFLFYSIFKANLNFGKIEVTAELVISFSITILLSIYLSYKFVVYNRKLKTHIESAENAVEYFSGESDKLKAIYENYVDTYLSENHKNK